VARQEGGLPRQHPAAALISAICAALTAETKIADPLAASDVLPGFLEVKSEISEYTFV
jgi:hypothetical protein